MKKHEMLVVTNNLKSNQKRKGNFRIKFASLFLFTMLIFSTNATFAHCDSMDGPLIADARKAIGQNNINYTLKWVRPENETEVKNAFNLMMKVRGFSADSKLLAETYFFETLVRIHRAAEGVPFTGLKPSGTPIDEKILAADKSIEIGNLSPLNGKVIKKDLPELTERFEKVMSLKNFDINNIEAGREYIEAYVQFFKFAEGEIEGHNVHGKGNEGNATEGVHGSEEHTVTTGHAGHLPWIFSGLLLITTILFGILYLRKKN